MPWLEVGVFPTALTALLFSEKKTTWKIAHRTDRLISNRLNRPAAEDISSTICSAPAPSRRSAPSFTRLCDSCRLRRSLSQLKTPWSPRNLARCRLTLGKFSSSATSQASWYIHLPESSRLSQRCARIWNASCNIVQKPNRYGALATTGNTT